MKDIIVTTLEGKQLHINIVRYFRLNGIEYLIFSLNEIDDAGYIKLYVSKIVDGVGKSIDDDVEWNLIKDTIKIIIKSNKENLPLPISDLNHDKINNIQIANQKIFKLTDSLLQLLIANQEFQIDNSVKSGGVLEVPNLNAVPTQQSPILDDHNHLNASNIYESTNDGNLNVVSNEIKSFDNMKFAAESNQDPNMLQPFDMPQFNNEQNVGPSIVQPLNTPQFNIGTNEVDNNAHVQTIDYQKLYEDELQKNEQLVNEVNRYKSVIAELTKILNNNI